MPSWLRSTRTSTRTPTCTSTCGTTGLSDAVIADLEKKFTKSNCVIAPNFAIGAILMMKFAAVAAPYFETAEILEFHHDQKVDSPSGTALLTAERMGAAKSDWAPDPTEHHVVAVVSPRAA